MHTISQRIECILKYKPEDSTVFLLIYTKHEKKLNSRGVKGLWYEKVLFSCDCAFRRKTLWETLGISAVVVYHVVLLHPLNSGLPCCIHWLLHPWLVWWWIVRWTRWAWRRSPNTCFSIEVPIRGCEWSLAPISFHQASPCGPVISIPKTWIYPHGLGFGKRNTFWFKILEFPYGCPIHRESNKRITRKG